MAKQHLIYSIILISLSFVIRVGIVAFHGFDGLYGQDAFAYYDFSLDLIDFVTNRNPPPPFHWSIGYPMILGSTMLVTQVSETIALSLSLIMGSLLSVFVYIIAIQLKIRPAYAFVAGLLMALSGQALQSSVVIMSDIPALFMALLSMVCLLQYINTYRRIYLLICAFAISFAVIIRLNYAVLPPLYFVLFLMTLKSRWHIFDLLLTVPFIIVAQVPQLVYSRYNPSNLLDHAWVDGWSVSNFFTNQFVNIDGTFQYEHINLLFYAYPTYDERYLSLLLTLFIIIGVIVLIRSRIWHQVVLLLGWILLPYLFLSGIPYQNIRFALIILPPVIILLALGLQTLVTLQYRIKWAFVILCLAGILHTAIVGFDYANSFVEHHQSEKGVVTWIDDKVPPDATIYTFGSTLTLQHYTDLNVIQIFYETPNTLNQRWFRGQVDYLLLNVWQIENQWQGRDPQANYHWFRDERGLTELGRFRNLTLFEAQE